MAMRTGHTTHSR